MKPTKKQRRKPETKREGSPPPFTGGDAPPPPFTPPVNGGDVKPRPFTPRDEAHVRTEGQRLLRMVPDSLSAIAAKTGASKTSASGWRSGAKVPDTAARDALFTAFQIPPVAWTRRPLGDVKPAPSLEASEPPVMRSIRPGTTLDECNARIAGINKDLEDKALHAAERAKLNTNMHQFLQLRRQLEKDLALLEDRMIRELPGWPRFEAALTKAITPYPEAARAVAEVMKQLDAGA